MIWFWLASLSPVVTIALAALAGGIWPVVALLHVTGFVLLMDRLPAPRGRPARADDPLPAVQALAHLALLPLVIWSLAQGGAGNPGLLALGLSAGLYFGQVSNSNAHELIHRPIRWQRGLGVAVFVSLLFGHHASAHLLVHHVHVATERDPNSARRGEGFWHFWPRAWIGSFRAGLRAERRRHGDWTNPYVLYLAGAAAWGLIALVLGGWGGVVVLVLLALHAQMQLLLADYVQHYGLRRATGADGRPEPVAARHAWNAPQWYSSAMMLNAPRHSDHHLHPMRAYGDLRLDPEHPVLPRSMPAMAALALVPPLWRRVMDGHLRQLAERT
ncbi:alkane 1-monooxygenase [Cribrihabitans marinus]|uniref:Alkane 1-monooxygenase n=1 Tax=Cribrihabitans marinus TaxID=1227549 RepID=A0A1H6TLE1_9RHOB|nr:alkane 1-monooxygenase [Cribrihabitans marinus]GGH22081.1 alkane 1-monooxygenase 2 [Cribrihabitans marinus]SEI77055.1 alkane 1-monooxygenase [Cribrihabitans marinus]